MSGKNQVQFQKLHPDVRLPERGSAGAAGYDIFAYTKGKGVRVHRRNGVSAVYTHAEGEVILEPGDKAIIPTGFKVALPEGMEMQIRPRSGNSFKTGLDIPNSPGTVDEDYRGEVGVIVKNANGHDLIIKHGDRIAQAVFQRYEVITPVIVGVLPSTERGERGFGSTDAVKVSA